MSSICSQADEQCEHAGEVGGCRAARAFAPSESDGHDAQDDERKIEQADDLLEEFSGGGRRPGLFQDAREAEDEQPDFADRQHQEAARPGRHKARLMEYPAAMIQSAAAGSSIRKSGESHVSSKASAITANSATLLRFIAMIAPAMSPSRPVLKSVRSNGSAL